MWRFKIRCTVASPIPLPENRFRCEVLQRLEQAVGMFHAEACAVVLHVINDFVVLRECSKFHPGCATFDVYFQALPRKLSKTMRINRLSTLA